MKDFNTAIQEAGYSRPDFRLETSEDDLLTERAGPRTGAVKVTNVKTGMSRTCPAGFDSTWPAQFTVDLQGKISG